MPEAVIAALVAAAVSGLAAVLSYSTNRRSLAAERRNLELQQRRRLTEKLLDLRLASYPRAFEITDQLRGERVFSGSLTPTDLQSVRDDLIAWHSTQAGFLLSDRSLKAWYQIRDALALRPSDSSESYSQLEVKQLWKAKNQFRGALKADIGLLYEEEREGPT